MLEPTILNQMSTEEILHYTNLHVYSDNHFRSLLTKATIVDDLRKKLVSAEEDYRNLESNTYNVIGSIDSFEKRMIEKYYEDSDEVEGDDD